MAKHDTGKEDPYSLPILQDLQDLCERVEIFLENSCNYLPRACATYLVQDQEVCSEDVMEFGAKKYSRDNWKTTEDGFNRYLRAGARHFLYEYFYGRDPMDPESGLPHLEHALASFEMASWHATNSKEAS